MEHKVPPSVYAQQKAQQEELTAKTAAAVKMQAAARGRAVRGDAHKTRARCYLPLPLPTVAYRCLPYLPLQVRGDADKTRAEAEQAKVCCCAHLLLRTPNPSVDAAAPWRAHQRSQSVT